MSTWPLFRGDNQLRDTNLKLPDPPPWRTFQSERPRGATFQASADEIRMVNAALFLSRPLLITGKPGTGKTSLAYAVANELQLGRVLRWSITSRSTLAEGLYRYDAIGRMQDANLNPGSPPAIGKYLRLGPLGTALLPSTRMRVLLVDELDKSDIDLPNDLLNIFEEGEYEIPELARLESPSEQVREYECDDTAWIGRGRVQCTTFPLVVITSNGEREFPPPFLRRCLRLDIAQPDKDKLTRIVRAHLGVVIERDAEPLIDDFLKRRLEGDIATDQLLNAIFLVTRKNLPSERVERERLMDALLRTLGSADLT